MAVDAAGPKTAASVAKLALCGLIWVLLSGCSALKFTYERGPALTYWWLDGYLDLERAQTSQARAAIREWFAWHRRTQLADYRELLIELQRELRADTAPAAVCEWNDRVRQRLHTAYAAAIPPLAALSVTLHPKQIARLARQFDKHNEDLAEEYLSGTAAERRAAVRERVQDTVRSLYGRLDRAQREYLARRVQASPFDAARWLSERRARQAEILAGLRALQDEPAEAPRRALAAQTLRQLGMQFDASPRAEYRAYYTELVAANCALIADLHNRMTPVQRARAIRKVRAWQQALDALLAESAAGNAE